MTDRVWLRALLITVSTMAVIGAAAPAAVAAPGQASPAGCVTSAPFDPHLIDVSPTNGTLSTSFVVTFGWTPVALPADCAATVQISLSVTVPSGAPASDPVSVPAASSGYQTTLAAPARYAFQARLVIAGDAGPWSPSPAEQVTVLPLDYCLGWVHPPSGTVVGGHALDRTSAVLSVDLARLDPWHVQLCGEPSVSATAIGDPTAPVVRFPAGATTATVTGLTPGRTYRWQVDVGGIVFGTVTITQPPAPGGCVVNLSVVGGWATYHQITATVTAGSTALTGWRVSWAAQGTVTQLWNGVLGGDATAPTTTVTNAPYNGAVPASQTTTFGFIVDGGDWSAVPAALACTPATS